MENTNKNYWVWTRISPWMLMGAVAVMIPILAVITVENINRQKEHSRQLLLGKGAALIRSFETGTRFGMRGMMGGGFKLQQLLMETAGQPDIAYLIVTDRQGRVQAHSDPEKIGARYGENLDLGQVVDSRELQWRLEPADGNGRAFEVYGHFRPHAGPRGMHDGRMGHHRRGEDRFKRPPPARLVIFVGLDTAAVDAARRAQTRHSLFMAAILLLAGAAGIALLFVAQSYRAARQSLSRIRSFSDRLVDNMPIGLVSLDVDRKVAAVNPAGRSVLNRVGPDPVGLDGKDVLPPELWTVVASLTGAPDVVEREMDCFMAQGKPVPIGVSASTWHDEDGQRLGHILLLRDLTEVYALRREIARSQRLASVGNLAAGVAHEIRNPLSSIKGFATYFRERAREEKDRETATIMIREVDRLNRVVSQLLELARPVRISRQPTRIAELIDRSLALIRAGASEAGIGIQWQPPAPSPEARVDADRIQQVLLNLFLNGMDAMDRDGTLTVSLNVDNAYRDLLIRVSDTGCGIPDGHQQQIFDPYFTTKSDGTGLGLAIVHNIIEAHAGKIDVLSLPGRGTRIDLRLPLNAEEKDIDEK
jgi:two-component system, NtrC family, sensor histidine kinase HydH